MSSRPLNRAGKILAIYVATILIAALLGGLSYLFGFDPVGLRLLQYAAKGVAFMVIIGLSGLLYQQFTQNWGRNWWER